ncbi:MAG TPA: mechanosensitive ion channel domain-containing protein, partial [Candidatus Nitrosotalea sp.]|nr:mechanosensitive ion channel domain-containing protein [Candidatus Nitrosotalea sp.]
MIKLRPVFSIPFLLAVQTFAAAPAPASSDPIRQVEVWKDKLVGFVIDHAGGLIGAIAIMIVGVIASRIVAGFMIRALQRIEMEPPVRLLLSRMARLLVIGMAVVMALGTAGANVAALVAGIGVAGVGIGLAMQGMLSNIVAGLTIIFTKPFRVGEYIELLGVQGQVDMVELFSTKLRHPDRSLVVIPNRKIVGEILHNYGTIRQLDLDVGVAYNTDLAAAIAAVREVLVQNPRVLKDPQPAVGVSVLGESSIHIAIRPWVKVPDYGPAGAELYQTILERFRRSEIVIPLPQTEVRML